MYKFTVKDPHFLPHSGCDLEILLKKGELFTIVGENGVGKSTFARFITQDDQKFSCVFQEALEVFYDRTLQRIKELYLSTLELPERTRFNALWKMFGLEQKENRHHSELSGGEGQALKLCLGLALEREIYLLDEPSQYLDTASKHKLSEFLKEELLRGKAFLLIEHDLTWITTPTRVQEVVVVEGTLQKGRAWNT